MSEQSAQDGDACSDAALLLQLQQGPDEHAFSAIVERHGPMVLGVCSRYLHQAADIEDAYQAVFLVLLRSLQRGIRQQCLGAWLHEVARRTALHAASRLGAQQQRQNDLPEAPSTAEESLAIAIRREVRTILDEEVGRLPSHYRLPMVLCHLQGRSKNEAAAELGWPTGTVSGRLARAKELLRSRLVKRGIAPAMALSMVNQSSLAISALPLAINTLLTATQPNVVQLAQGILTMWALRKKIMWTGIVASLFLLAGTTGAGAYWLLQPTPQSGNTTPAQPIISEQPQNHAADLDGLWLEVQRDEVTNEIQSINRLFIKDGKYKLMRGLAVSGRGNPFGGLNSGQATQNYPLEVHDGNPASIVFYGSYFALVRTTPEFKQGDENKWKTPALFELKQDVLKLYFYINADATSAQLPPGVSVEKPQPAAPSTLRIRTFQRETPEYASGQLKSPSPNHPLLREGQADKPVVENTGDHDELIKLLEKKVEIYQGSPSVTGEEKLRAKLEVLRARLNHPRISLKEKQQIASDFMLKLSELNKIAETRFNSGNITGTQLIDVQISVLKARIEFRQYLKNDSK